MARKEISVAVCSDVGRKRKANEDATMVIPEAGIFCLADGMGGVEGGAVASQQTLKIVKDTLGDNPRVLSFTDKVQRIDQALLQANQWIINWANARGNKGCGTTFVALLLDFAGRARTSFFNAGDSRGYCYHQGTLRQITHDHSVASEFSAQRNGAVPAIFKNVIINAIGTQETFSLEPTGVPTEPGDIFLLCSDGLTTMLSDPEIARILAGHTTAGLQHTAQALIRAANSAGGLDNITVILVQILAPLQSGESEQDHPLAEMSAPGPRPDQKPPKTDVATDAPISDDSEVLAYGQGDEAPTANHGPRQAQSGRRWLMALVALGLLVLAALAVLTALIKVRATREDPIPLTPSVPVTHVASGPQTSQPPQAQPTITYPALTDAEIIALVQKHIVEGTLGELDARLQHDEKLREQLRANRKESEAFAGWLGEWQRNNTYPDRVPVEYDMCQNIFTKLAVWIDVPVRSADVTWPQNPAERATRHCQLMNQQQESVLGAILVVMDRWNDELAVLGDKPEQTLRVLERLSGQPGLRDNGLKLPVAVADLRRWIAKSRPRPISAEDWERVVLPAVTDLQAGMGQLWSDIWKSVGAISPESLRNLVPSDKIPVALESKRRNLAALGQQDLESIRTTEESRGRVQAILRYLVSIADIAKPATANQKPSP